MRRKPTLMITSAKCCCHAFGAPRCPYNCFRNNQTFEPSVQPVLNTLAGAKRTSRQSPARGETQSPHPRCMSSTPSLSPLTRPIVVPAVRPSPRRIFSSSPARSPAHTIATCIAPPSVGQPRWWSTLCVRMPLSPVAVQTRQNHKDFAARWHVLRPLLQTSAPPRRQSRSTHRPPTKEVASTTTSSARRSCLASGAPSFTSSSSRPLCLRGVSPQRPPGDELTFDLLPAGFSLLAARVSRETLVSHSPPCFSASSPRKDLQRNSPRRRRRRRQRSTISL